MSGIKAKKDNTMIGTLLKPTTEFSHSAWVTDFINKYPNVEYVKVKSFHPNAGDVIRVDAYDAFDNLIKVGQIDHLAIGYNGDFEAVHYTPKEKFNLDDIFANLDKIADKIK